MLLKTFILRCNFEQSKTMDTLLRGNADEIDNSLITFIKSTFKGKKVAVHIYEDDTMDETEYILSDPIAKERLLSSIKNVKNHHYLREYTLDEIESIVNDASI